MRRTMIRQNGFCCTRQQGMGYTGLLVVLVMTVFVSMFVVKLVPMYIESWTVIRIADEAAAQPNLLKRPRLQVYEYLNQAYKVNNIQDLKAEDTVELERHRQHGYVVKVSYERRTTLFNNIDVVAQFEKTVGGSL